MPRDRRRGKKPHHRHGPARPGPVSQQPSQPVSGSKHVPVEKAVPLARASTAVKQPVVGNPRLAKDLRNVGMVAVSLMVLLIVISLFI